MAEKYREGTKTGTLRLNEEFHREVKLAAVAQGLSFKSAIEEGLKMWLGHIRGDEALQKSLGTLSAYEQKWCIMLLSILRSKDRKAIAGTESILVLYRRAVEISEG